MKGASAYLAKRRNRNLTQKLGIKEEQSEIDRRLDSLSRLADYHERSHFDALRDGNKKKAAYHKAEMDRHKREWKKLWDISEEQEEPKKSTLKRRLQQIKAEMTEGNIYSKETSQDRRARVAKLLQARAQRIRSKDPEKAARLDRHAGKVHPEPYKNY